MSGRASVFCTEEALEKESPSSRPEFPSPKRGDAKNDRRSLLALGVALFVFGTIGLALASLRQPTEIRSTGLLLLGGGGAQLLYATVIGNRQPAPRLIAASLLYLTAGLTVISSPALASRPATLVVAGSLIGIGAIRIGTARLHRGILNGEWILIGGIAAILLGIMIGAGWPVAGSQAAALALSSELIFNAWACLILAQTARGRARRR